MLIRELLTEGRPVMSLEIFPPKPGANPEKMRGVVREMASLRPDFISVTYSANNGTAQSTVDIANFVQSQGVPALAHVTCVSQTRADIDQTLGSLSEKGIENILALRGDIPETSGHPAPGSFQYASELVEHIRTNSGHCIGAACYPEGHVESANQNSDIEYVKRKVEAGCDFLITQMFFDNNILYRFLYRLLAREVRVPVFAGIMPVTNRRQIERIVKLSGTALPPRFVSILDRFGANENAMRQAGIAYATEQIIDLIANGVEHVHLYTMNRPDVAAAIMGNLSVILGR